MYQIIYHPDAENEFLQSVHYYETQQKGLGRKFINSFNKSIDNIKFSPESWPILEDDIRRYLLSTFPFGILYRKVRNTIRILAVMHLKRDPDYWKDRKDF
jgi:plasmid stabilization system protein ParE